MGKNEEINSFVDLEVQYPYDKVNRLENPEKYQFSIYGGKQFLRAYEESREAAMQHFESQLSEIHAIDDCKVTSRFIIENYFGETKSSDNKSRNDDISTVQELSSNWNKILNRQSTEELDQIIGFIMVFLKKFEVSKKIYEQYEPSSYRRSSTEYKNITNYLLFSNLLCDFYGLISSEHQRLTVFNTILKVNDLIVSIHSNIYQLREILLAVLCLQKEKNIYQSLIEEE